MSDLESNLLLSLINDVAYLQRNEGRLREQMHNAFERINGICTFLSMRFPDESESTLKLTGIKEQENEN